MSVFVRAVVTGFGFTLGAAIFRKVSDRLGLGEEKPDRNRSETAPDPGAVVTPGTGDQPGQHDDGAVAPLLA